MSLSLSGPIVLGAFAALGYSLYQWRIQWMVSGTPLLMLCLLLGASNGRRILPFIPLWFLLSAINIVYSVVSPSWVLLVMYSSTIYPTILFAAITQFDLCGWLVRRSLRRVLTQVSFVDDTIALFQVPSLKLDVDVDGLMVVRAVTMQLSRLRVKAFGIEVGIQVNEEIEIGISVEEMTVALFRGVQIGDCYVNVKSKLPLKLHVKGESDGEAHPEHHKGHSSPKGSYHSHHGTSNAESVMAESPKRRKTPPSPSEARSEAAERLETTQAIPANDQETLEHIRQMLKTVQQSNTISQSRRTVLEDYEESESEAEEYHTHEPTLNPHKDADLRAAICSRMQGEPITPHRPTDIDPIKVTTLKHVYPPRVRQTLHRMPFLLRLLLNPICYLHPVKISAVSAAISGSHISRMLDSYIFLDYTEESRELRRLQKHINEWLNEANFVIEIIEISGDSSVPLTTSFDILTLLRIKDIVVGRSLHHQMDLERVIRIGGGDCSVTIPSYLLPHHEHLLPPKPSKKHQQRLAEGKEHAEDKIERVLKEQELEKAIKDESSVLLSVHARLPMFFAQDVLDFIAALVKASKLIDFEKEAEEEEKHKISGFKDFTHTVSKGMKEGLRRTTVEGIINDHWIAKMVGKITKKLEEAKGEAGYTGEIPVKLEKYRLPYGHPEQSKILP